MATLPAHIFREYDLRGLVGSDLEPAGVTLLGQGLGTLVRRAQGRTVVLGRDARLSSPAFREAMTAGLTSTGVDVIDVGVVPTPVVYFAAHTLPVDGLVMITGSHNPAEYNGFKLGLGSATFFGEQIQALRALIESKDLATADRPGTVTHFDAITPYLHFVTSTVRRGPRVLKVVIDAGNGVGGLTALPMLERLGYEVVPLFCEPDGRFPNHHADPTVAKNLTALIAAVKEHRADLGIGFDGDADRIGVVDEHGHILWGDQLLILLGRALLADVPGATVVGEVKCSFTLYDDLKAKGGVPLMWKTGHSLIKAKMKETHALLAGEMSGHIFYKHRFFGFDDAPYTAARLLEILSASDRPLSTYLADVPVTFATPELKVEAAESTKFELVKRCLHALKARGLSTIDIDGVRVTWADGWGLIRASNTTPLLVVRCEATTQRRLEEIQALLDATIAEARAGLGA